MGYHFLVIRIGILRKKVFESFVIFLQLWLFFSMILFPLFVIVLFWWAISFCFAIWLRCMEKRIFFWQKFVKRTEKVIFLLVFLCFRFTETSYFLDFPSNENVRKQHLSVNAYSCVDMKFLYTLVVRKDKNFYVVL